MSSSYFWKEPRNEFITCNVLLDYLRRLHTNKTLHSSLTTDTMNDFVARLIDKRIKVKRRLHDCNE